MVCHNMEDFTGVNILFVCLLGWYHFWLAANGISISRCVQRY